ncbi:SAV_915 family protein [Streptomyces sp. I05A-00742]|uniref:SAV_915 family protein n=1 Tax=Streptomyces sp. I05A-00742 TaxID=2732853 RepID=UPI001489CBB3|nr:SAV_915 family protein [Streptomyces sp. I05A-00742]
MSTPTLTDDETVLAPARPRPADGWERTVDQVAFETRRAADGADCGMAFTSAERLVACLGPDQPWVALPLGALRLLLGEAGVPRVIVDPPTAPASEEASHQDEREACRG